MSRHKTTEFKKQLSTAFLFILSIGAFYTLFWFVLKQLNLEFLKKSTAIVANWMLHLAGVPSVVYQGADPSIVVGSVTAQITNLCAGDLEIALITAIILSTFDRSWKSRAWGVLFAWLLILVINPLRIFAVLAVGYYSSWQWADFTHDVLFRLTLLVVIVFYYFIWYVKSERVKKGFLNWCRRVFLCSRR